MNSNKSISEDLEALLDYYERHDYLPPSSIIVSEQTKLTLESYLDRKFDYKKKWENRLGKMYSLLTNNLRIEDYEEIKSLYDYMRMIEGRI